MPFGSASAEPGMIMHGKVVNTTSDGHVWVRHEEKDTGYSMGVFELHYAYVEPGTWFYPPRPAPVWVPE